MPSTSSPEFISIREETDGCSGVLHIAAGWVDALAAANVHGFEDLWQLPQDWVDNPNTAGEGWSAVSRHEFGTGTGTPRGVFTKRSENYYLKRVVPLLPRTMVLRREVRNLLAYQRRGIPALELVAWGERRIGGKDQGIVVTAALDGFVSLEDVVAGWENGAAPCLAARRRWIREIADSVRGLHDRGMRHNMLRLKHIFVRKELVEQAPDALPQVQRGDVRFIDLENSSRKMLWLVAAYKDLDRLNRSAIGVTPRDRLAFFLHYMRRRMTILDRLLLGKIAARTQGKSRRSRQRAAANDS